MPWCPKCKQEYREGIECCADCGSELVAEEPVEEAALVLLVSLDNEGMAARLAGFLNSQNVTASLSVEEGKYSIYIDEKNLKHAKNLFKAFYTVEAEIAANAYTETRKNLEDTYGESYWTEDARRRAHEKSGKAGEESLSSDTNDEEYSDDEEYQRLNASKNASNAYQRTNVYETKAEKGRDLKSTGYTFIFFGIAGFIFLILNIIGVVSLYNNMLAYIVMSVMFAGFIVIGIGAFKDSKKALAAAGDEEKLTADIKAYLKANANIRFLESYDDPELGPEMNFMRRFDALKLLVNNRFEGLEDIYVDAIVEEFYNENFDFDNNDN